jgi:hypothetical protein
MTKMATARHIAALDSPSGAAQANGPVADRQPEIVDNSYWSTPSLCPRDLNVHPRRLRAQSDHSGHALMQQFCQAKPPIMTHIAGRSRIDPERSRSWSNTSS